MNIAPGDTEPDYPPLPDARKNRTTAPMRLAGVSLPLSEPEYPLRQKEQKLMYQIECDGVRKVRERILSVKITNEHDERALASRLAKFDRVIQFMKENDIDIPE